MISKQVAHHQDALSAPRCFHHLPSLARFQSERLLHKDVFAGCERLQRHPAVLFRWSGKGNGCHTRVRESFGEFGVSAKSGILLGAGVPMPNTTLAHRVKMAQGRKVSRQVLAPVAISRYTDTCMSEIGLWSLDVSAIAAEGLRHRRIL